MSYSKIKLTEIILAAAFAAAFAVEMNLSDGISFHIFLMLSIGTGVLFLVPILYLDHLETKQYPQWKNIWKIPQEVVVFLIVLIVIMVAAAFLTDCNLSWVIIIILFLRPCLDYYYAQKYDMDNLTSIEQLLTTHPEAREKLRNIVLGG